jgi:hypothetical protein
MKKQILSALLIALAFPVLAVDVTFKVDMNTAGVNFATPEVNGIFNNWCGNCAPMSDENSDGIWELVIDLAPGTYEYKFSADNWGFQETLVSGSECTLTTGNFVNRIITVTGATELEAVCWGQCTPCGEGPTTTNVTFRVDMSEVAEAFTTPEINGTFNGWCGGCAPMSDDDGDNIWEITVAIQGESIEYKFAADAWELEESLTPGSDCTITTDSFTNRFLNLEGGVLVLESVCWGECEACIVSVNEEAVDAAVTLYPNPARSFFRVATADNGLHAIELFSTDGRLVRRFASVGANDVLNIEGLPAGVYQVVALNGTHRSVQRLVIE